MASKHGGNMKPEQQLIFNDIEYPNAPGISTWIIAAIIVSISLALLFFAYRYYQNNRRLIKSFINYQWLHYRGLQKLETTREKAEQIYRLLIAHFNLNHLPEPQQLPTLLSSQAENWTSFKQRLNEARFSKRNCSEDEIAQLMRQCRCWIKKAG